MPLISPAPKDKRWRRAKRPAGPTPPKPVSGAAPVRSWTTEAVTPVVAFVTLALHKGFDVAALRQLFAVKGFQAFDHHQVGTGDGRAGVAAQAHGIGVAVSEDAVFGRAEEVGQCVLDGNGRGVIEEMKGGVLVS